MKVVLKRCPITNNECDEKYCAWWSERKQKCAALVIAEKRYVKRLPTV